MYFPPGIYLVSRPLNCTTGQFNLVGAGVYQTVLRGATGDGNPVIDFTGAGGGYCSVRDMYIDCPYTLDTDGNVVPDPAASTVGILIAREQPKDPTPQNQSGASVSQINLANLIVRLVSDPKTNNGNGTVAVYNFGGEEANYHNVYLRGDCGLCITSENSNKGGAIGYGLTSQYTHILLADTSTTAITVTGLTSLIGIAGPALRLMGGAALQVDAFLATHAGTTGFVNVPAYPFAIHSRPIWVDFRHTGSMEGFDGLLHVDKITMYHARLYSYMGRTTAQPAICLSGGGSLVGADVDVAATNAEAETVTCLIGDDGVSVAKVIGCHVKLRNQTIQLKSPGSQIIGNVIQTEVPLATALTNVSAASVIAGNVITATDGVQANGITLGRATGWGAPTGTATRSAFDTVTATTEDLAQRLKALIDDLTARGYLGA